VHSTNALLVIILYNFLTYDPSQFYHINTVPNNIRLVFHSFDRLPQITTAYDRDFT
jgi:hypothetical protein